MSNSKTEPLKKMKGSCENLSNSHASVVEPLSLIKLVTDEKKQDPAKEIEYWKQRASDLQDSLNSTLQQLTEQYNESNATSELLGLQLYRLQLDLHTSIQDKQSMSTEFANERNLLIKQNNQLQEQLEQYVDKYHQSTKAINTLSKFAQEVPQLKLLSRMNKTSLK